MRPFDPDALVNVALPVQRRLDGRSFAAVTKLAAWARMRSQPISASASHTAGSPWFNQFPVYYVDSATPRRLITLKVSWWMQTGQQALCAEVPIPDAAVGDVSADSSLVIVDPASGMLYDFWQFKRAEDGTLSVSAMGVMRDYHNGSCAYDETAHAPESSLLLGTCWGVQASGFSHLAGLVMVDELRAGVIDHAIAMAVPWAAKDWFSHPAQRTDGRDTAAGAIPYGGRFALPASFDLDAYTIERRRTVATYTPTAVTRTIVQAWRTYGLVAMDQTGLGIGLQVEDARSWLLRNPGAPHPYTGPGGLLTQTPNVEMALLPWEKLQLLALDLRRRP